MIQENRTCTNMYVCANIFSSQLTLSLKSITKGRDNMCDKCGIVINPEYASYVVCALGSLLKYDYNRKSCERARPFPHDILTGLF